MKFEELKKAIEDDNLFDFIFNHGHEMTMYELMTLAMELAYASPISRMSDKGKELIENLKQAFDNEDE